MNMAALRNLYLRSLTEAAGDEEEKEDTKKKKDKKKDDADAEADNTENTEEEAPAEDTETPEDTESEDTENAEEVEENPDGEESTEEGDMGDEGGEESPEGDTEGDTGGDDMGGEGDAGGGEGDDGGLGDFSLDGDGEEEDLGPAPDGLPEADDDGSNDEMEDADPDGETNVQVNILNLSKLDRALAKRTCFQNFKELRATVNATLSLIDKHEATIDPDVREKCLSDLNNMSTKIDEFLMFKFPIMNYEDGLQAYFTFVQEVNKLIEYVKNDGITGKKGKH